MKKYWMNRVEGGGPPVQPIADHDHAITRAKALAKKTGKPVHILGVEEIVTPVTVREAEVELRVTKPDQEGVT